VSRTQTFEWHSGFKSRQTLFEGCERLSSWTDNSIEIVHEIFHEDRQGNPIIVTLSKSRNVCFAPSIYQSRTKITGKKQKISDVYFNIGTYLNFV
jgi:hypothetical protein